MKSKINHITRVTLALVLYVVCSSVVCCEACKHTMSAVSIHNENSNTVQEENINIKYNNAASVDEDLSPLSLGSIRLSELL